jgi:hypothetical protein
MFRLPIALGVISRAHLQRCTSQFEQGLPELTGEDPVAIRDNYRRKTVELINMVHKKAWLQQLP